jgi:hypothetical protein
MPFVVQASAVVQYTKIVADPSRSATQNLISEWTSPRVISIHRRRSFRIRSNITEGALQATRGDAKPYNCWGSY